MAFEEFEFIWSPTAFRPDRQRERAGGVGFENLLQAESLWRFVLGKQNASSLRVLDRGLEVSGSGDFGFRRASRLLRCFASDSSPTLHSFVSGFGEVRLGAPGDHRDDGSSAKLDSFLQCPLEAVEFEDREEQGDLSLLARS